MSTSSLFESEPEAGTLVRIVLERGMDAPTGLTYLAPARLGEPVVGDCVEAPLGRGNRFAAGYIIEIGASQDIDLSRMKPIHRLTGRRLPVSLIRLAEWIAAYYACPLGTVLRAMAPAAVKDGVKGRTITLLRPCVRVDTESAGRVEPKDKLTVNQTSPAPDSTSPQPSGLTSPLPPKTEAAWRAICALPAGDFPMTGKELALRIDAATLAPINRLRKLGYLESIERPARTVPYEIASWEVAGEASPGESARDEIGPSGSGHGVGHCTSPVKHGGLSHNVLPSLTAAQARAVKGIVATLGSFTPHLLFGVTGSGKTEVYLRVLERALERGESAIVLVPEICLTPQTVSRFASRFHASGVATIHSGLTKAQRRSEWNRIASGDARIAIGARSALFAPFVDGGRDARSGSSDKMGARLGLIIVDEEHESAYKQDEAPRHHARDVALKRAQLAGCPIILGSATPSLESWRNALIGRYTLHELPERVGGARLPSVRLVDLADEMRLDTTSATRLTMVGPTLRHALRETLDAGGQAILLLNRRGWASYICCPDHRCGWALMCDQCDAAMVYHRAKELPVGGVVRCHHCLSARKLPANCPVCGKKVTPFGAGCQRVEDELRRCTPEAASGDFLRRVDSDSMSTSRDYFEALGAFSRGETRILLGTQMLAKGHDFPGVDLVGVINADTALNLPDFRASERTFQLVAQVAGRAGRGSRPGRVIVQTFNPDQPAIRFAAKHDFKSFAVAELPLRERAGLPPVTRMARIIVRHEHHEIAVRKATAIAEALEQGHALWPTLRISGPAPCAIARLRNQHRIAMELLAPDARVIQAALTYLRNQGLAKSDALTAIDVDPVSLM